VFTRANFSGRKRSYLVTKVGGSARLRIAEADRFSHFFHSQDHYTVEVSALNIEYPKKKETYNERELKDIGQTSDNPRLIPVAIGVR